MSPPSREPDALRNRPRQKRSRERVEALLAAAEVVFERVGFEKSSTALVAEEAGVPIGTLYRWFPDKDAIAMALCERYLDEIEQLYDELLSTGADEPIAVLIRRVLSGLEAFAMARPALGAIASTTDALTDGHTAGERLRSALHGHVVALLDFRVDGLDGAVRDEVADAIVTVVNAFLVRAGERSSADRPPLFHYLGDFVIAFVESKFPPPQSPIWTDPDRPIQPLVPGRFWPYGPGAAPEGEPADAASETSETGGDTDADADVGGAAAAAPGDGPETST